MSEKTPETFIDFIDFGEESYMFLNYSITVGHSQLSNTSYYYFIFGLIIIIFYFKKNRRKLRLNT